MVESLKWEKLEERKKTNRLCMLYKIKGPIQTYFRTTFTCSLGKNMGYAVPSRKMHLIKFHKITSTVQELAIEDGQALPKHCWYCDSGLSHILLLCTELAFSF
jgi:hypothetical protein